MADTQERLAKIDLNLGQQIVAKRANTKPSDVVFLKPGEYAWLSKQETLTTPFAWRDGEVTYADCRVVPW